ncbi:MAG: signal peptidase I [Anaerolineales bacterium]|jgi:signal peptidase
MQVKSFLNSEKISAHSAWLPVAIGLAVAFCLQSNLTFRSIDAELRDFLLLPLLWIDIALYSLWGWYRGILERPRLDRLVVAYAFIAGFLAVTGILISGWLWGIGNSPYNHNFPTFIGYLFYISSILVGLETARAYLLIRWKKASPLLGFLLIVFLFAVLATPAGVITQLKFSASSIDSIWKTMIPNLSQSLLLTYMAWIGGPWMAIIYRLFPLYFEWLSPILPDLNLYQNAFINTLLPIGILTLMHMVASQSEEVDSNNRNPSYEWFLVVIFSVSLLWLNSGLLGVRTFLIRGGSMEPVLEAGDVVIVQPSDPGQIQTGDIILFNYSEKWVMHRVIEIRHSSGALEFITKGDANKVPDQPVTIHQVKGEALVKIPKIGWLSLILKKLIGSLV